MITKENNMKTGLRKIVNPIGLLVTQQDEKRDATTVAWISKVSNTPPLIMISVAPERYGYRLVEQTKEFVLAILSERQEQLALYCGNHTAYEVDKFREANIQTDKASYVKAPLIEDAVANFECKVKEMYQTGDHVMVIGEVLATHIGRDERPLIMTDKIGTIEF